MAKCFNQKTSSILFNSSIRIWPVSKPPIKTSKCKTNLTWLPIISRNQLSQPSINRTHQFHHRVKHQYQISWAPNQTQPTDLWKRWKWTSLQSCKRDGIDPTTYFHKSIWKILWSIIPHSIMGRKPAKSINITLNSHS